MTKLPQGLMWYLVSLVMYCLGMVARITWDKAVECWV